MLGYIPAQLSNCVRKLGFVSADQLNFIEQINDVKRNVIVNLINISRIVNFIDKESKMKLILGLVFSITEFATLFITAYQITSSMVSK